MDDKRDKGGEELAPGDAIPQVVESIPATLDDLKKLESSIMTQMQSMLAGFFASKENQIPSAEANQSVAPAIQPFIKFVPETNKPNEKDSDGVGTFAPKGNGDPKVRENQEGFHAVAPPNDYAFDPPVPMPHIVPQGPPPILDSSSFANWQFLMHSHVRSSSTELWRIIKEGYKPRDPSKLTRREVVDDQLNATALHMIHMAVTPKDRAHIRSLETAKEAWDHLTHLFLGNESIQSSRFDEVNTMADGFVMNDGETVEDMYRRLTALALTMRDLGAAHANDKWIKRKFYNALLPYEETRLNAIRNNSNFHAMTSNEVLSEIIAMDIAKKNAEEIVARAHGARKTNLALKAKVMEESDEDEAIEWAPEDMKYDYHEHMALAAKKFWGNNRRGSKPRDNSRYSPRDSSRDNSRGFSNSPKESNQRARTCYNCGDKNHFVADCHFERREDHGGRLVRKDKYKTSSNKIYTKFSPTRTTITRSPSTRSQERW